MFWRSHILFYSPFVASASSIPLLSFLFHFFLLLLFFFFLPLYVLILFPIPTPPSTPSPVTRRDVRKDLPFSFMYYMDYFRDLLDARLFAATYLSEDAPTVCDEQHSPECDTTGCAWKNLWWHLGDREASELSCYLSDSDLPYVRCYENFG